MPVARHLLVASLSLFAAAAGAAQTHYAWVGTYNPNGEGLYRFTVDAKTGALRDKTLVSSLPNVAQLTVSRDGKRCMPPVKSKKAWCRRGALKRTAS
ncbi:6-phosphogluconolactonase [Klebsiella pneumoniae]|uniref:6-phosphogluconolactonase n=1 Tax=Klebsiella pneumoniae TaxID=573 RepID=A0A4P0XRN7_KLEPN|nr:6-phosphogluconolactonase [Klebsiella pneumoniae]